MDLKLGIVQGRLLQSPPDQLQWFPQERWEEEFPLAEETALRLGLIFRMLAPMRSRNKMTACLQGIEAMHKEEAAYWLGMALHRKHPRRVLMALRFLLTDPKRPT